MWDHVQNLITKLTLEVTLLRNNFKITNNFQRKWLDVVAGRKESEQKQPSTIPTVITSKVPSIMMTFAKKAYGIKDNQKINCGITKEET